VLAGLLGFGKKMTDNIEIDNGSAAEVGGEGVVGEVTEVPSVEAVGDHDEAASPEVDGEPDDDSETPYNHGVVEPSNENLKWYVVHTYSGYENRAKASLTERIAQLGLKEHFGEVLIPMESVVELGKGGQKRTSKRKFFPSYMLVQMELNDETWHLVKGTSRITGFVGGSRNPPSVSEEEVSRLTQQISEGTLKPKPKVHFEDGEDVRVIDGPFANFNGVVDQVNEDKGKVRVMVSIFGRFTPVELDFVQVEKA